MRGHRNGHTSSVNETLAMLALGSSPGDNVSQTNAAPIGPAIATSWNSTPFTPTKTGKVLVVATITGNDATVSEAVLYRLLKNPTAATGANFAALGGAAIGPAGMQTDAGLAGDFGNTIAWIDSVTDGTAVSYGIAAQSSAAHNLTVPTGGAVITVTEIN